MTALSRPRFAARAAILAALTLVLLFRTLIPAGYMIAPTGGWPVLTLCESSPPAAAHHEGHDQPAKPKQPCAYAALASPALPPAPPLFAAPSYPSRPAAPQRAAGARTAPEPASLPPPSTGPPHLA